MDKNPHKFPKVTHDIQGRPVSDEVSAALTRMGQNLSDKGWEKAQEAKKDKHNATK